MDSSSWWLHVAVALCVAGLLKLIIDTFFFSPSQKNLPPGPRFFPIIGSCQWLFRSYPQIRRLIDDLHACYGPIVTIYVGRVPFIFVASHEIAHRALVQNGSTFADRPPPFITSRFICGNRININISPYGPTWRLFRRNLASEVLHPSRTRSFSKLRRRSLDILLRHLSCQPGGEVVAMEHFQFAMFCVLVLMCFGDQLEEDDIKQVEDCQRQFILRSNFSVLNFWPRLGKILFPKRWQELSRVRNNQEEIFRSLLRGRSKFVQEARETGHEHELITSYADSLLDLEMPTEKRKLKEEEVISLCSEFLTAGTDTTSTALKAVVLEGLRRHPPGHLVLPHAVTQDTELNGYLIPKKGSINFMVAKMGRDPKVWEDPMEFKPERFLDESSPNTYTGTKEDFDITGSREIKMMPFGAGRRICPGYGLAILHLEYFLANLIWQYQWKAVDGDEVDLREKLEFTVVMKKPLRAIISPRHQ